MSTELRRVHLIATGGTIASKATSSTAVVGYTGYAPSVFSIADLLEAVPGAEEAAQLTAEQLFRKQSPDITDQDMMCIGRRIQEVLDRDEADGVVLVMGTDTIEEVSYFLHLTLKTHCPVVVVGAMRPAGVLSSDGPLNLYNAIRVAAAPQSRDQGVLVVMNDFIICARDVMKASSCKVESFGGGYYGVVGTVRNGQVTFFYRTARPFGLTSRFSLKDLPEVLPRVDNIYMYQGCGADLVKAAFTLKPEALVIGGFGNGAIHNEIRDYYRAHKGEDLPILVRACRAPYGGSFGDYGRFDEVGCFPAGDMLPSKIRILMKLALSQTHDLEEIKAIFAQY